MFEIFPERRAQKQELYSFDEKMSRYIGSIARSALVSSNSIAFTRLDFPSPLYRVRLCSLRFACVTSVCVRFRSKEQGTRVKDRAKNGASKKPGGSELSFHFSRGQNRKSRCLSFLGLSLLRNTTGNACYAVYLAVYASRCAGSFHEKRFVIEQSSPDIHTLEKLKQMDERKRTFETRKTKAACVFRLKDLKNMK